MANKQGNEMLSLLQIPEIAGFVFGFLIGALIGCAGGVCVTIAIMAIVH